MDITEDSEFERKPVVVTPKCEEQLDEAIIYMEKRSETQAAIMRSQFFKAVKLLEIFPGIGTIYKNGMRKMNLGKFRR